tara:strand:+ start:43 stop:234 length:192 start_codon:yes stop_codon:yes gene_type:complete
MPKKKSSLGGKILKWGAGTAGTTLGIDFIANLLQSIPMKDGGRVKGVGKATHGFGKAMKKKKK